MCALNAVKSVEYIHWPCVTVRLSKPLLYSSETEARMGFCFKSRYYVWLAVYTLTCLLFTVYCLMFYIELWNVYFTLMYLDFEIHLQCAYGNIIFIWQQPLLEVSTEFRKQNFLFKELTFCCNCFFFFTSSTFPCHWFF